MTYDFRLPNITAEDSAGQLKQMQSYMYQLVEQLNLALVTIDKQTESIVEAQNQPITEAQQQAEANNTFASIKSLIIKSADIIEAYSEELRRQYDGLYVAQSDFGTYKEETSQIISENSSNITQLLSDIQTLTMDMEKIIATQAYIKSGILDYDSGGLPIIGVEVGQTTTDSGVEVFNRFARFTAGGVYFYLANQDDPIAWMSGQKLYITNAEITATLRLGGYNADLSSGIAFKWVG